MANNTRNKQIDKRFFERFGALYSTPADMVQCRNQMEKQQFSEAAACLTSTAQENNGVAELSDPGNTEECEVESSDSETEDYFEDHSDKSLILNVSCSIDKLYSEILYVILHAVGCDVNRNVVGALLSYAQDAFGIPNEKHRELLSIVEKKKKPDLSVVVEIIKAKELAAKDSNGLSDPFVTLYLENDSSHRFNTSVCDMTLNPVWNQTFILPINNSMNDMICLEVWDLDPAVTIKGQLGRLSVCKNVRKLAKEIAASAVSQHANELIGITRIPLKTITASGMTLWYTLDNKKKAKGQGLLEVRTSLSFSEIKQVTVQEHVDLRRIILLHELEVNKVEHYEWSGNFSPQGDQLLTQHMTQSRMTEMEVALCSYCAYAGIHQKHPLSFSLFSKLIEKLSGPLLNEIVPKLFWEATTKLLPSCFRIIRNIRISDSDTNSTNQVKDVLKVLHHIMALNPKDIDFFPSNQYPWIKFPEDGPHCNIQEALIYAISIGFDKWWKSIIKKKKTDGVASLRIQRLIQMTQLVRTDLQKAVEDYNKLFIQCVGIPYAKSIYTFLEPKLSTLCEPVVSEICKNLKPVKKEHHSFRNNPEKNNESAEDPFALETLIFELYLTIQKFVTLGQEICPNNYNEFNIKNFYQWFHESVTKWLDISVFKAFQRIEKAVELDQLVLIDNTVNYSSSAVDTVAIFYQINTFWKQLSWPDVESCYAFIAKIIDDICRCSIFYSEKMSSKIDSMNIGQIDNENNFIVTNGWCLAINNIDYVRSTLEPFAQDLGIEEVLTKMAQFISVQDVDKCRDTLNIVIANAVDVVQNATFKLLQTIFKKMAPSMKRLLIEGSESTDQTDVDRLISYIDRNLETMNSELSEDIFSRCLELMWITLDETLDDIIQNNSRRPPFFFANLHKTITLMFGAYNDGLCCDALKQTEHILRINGLETPDLMHEVHLDLANAYEQLTESPYGEISFRCSFDGDDLKIEVMNARGLAVMDTNGSSDPFVQIHLLPEHIFSDVKELRTKTHYKDLFPLFDETFTINLSDKQRTVENGLILFTVKDEDMKGLRSELIGEAFHYFKDISTDIESDLTSSQVKKWLGKPTALGTEAVKALEIRSHNDNQAKKFLKSIKKKMAT